MINLGKEEVDKYLVKVLAKKYLDSSSPILSRALSGTYDKDDVLYIKKAATIYFQDKVLPALHRLKTGQYSDDIQKAIDITVINNEVNSYFSDFINDSNIDQFEYVVKHDERLTTNYYSNKYGIKDMNFSEIKQKKADYFYRNLKSKFPIINSEDPVFYTASGKITIIRTNGKPVESDWVEVTPKIDVNGFRVNDEGDIKYKFPENAKLYSRIVNNRKEELLVTDMAGMIEAISKGFALYHYTENLDLKNVRYISDETALMDLASRQYKTWLKSNIAVSSRIPAQALAFGMVMDTVGYLP